MELEYSENENFWDNPKANEWITAFSLPLLPWTKSFLPILGLPEILMNNLETWNSIYSKQITKYEKQIRERDWVKIRYEGRGDLLRQTVAETLHQIERQIGRDVAVSFEQWVYFHVFCEEFSLAMDRWATALRYAYLSPDSRLWDKKLSLPVLLVPVLPEILESISLEKRNEIKALLKQSTPLIPEQQVAYEALDRSYEAVLLSKIIDQALTLRSLQIIAQRLNNVERWEVVDWAKNQLQIISPKYGYLKSQELCEDKYLQTHLPCLTNSLV